MITFECARRLYPPVSGSAHGFDHVLRVTALAVQIAREENADLEIVRTAALLHDLAADGENRKEHHLIGAERAREILSIAGHPLDRVDAVVHCIRTHRFRRPEDSPQTLEAKCVYDADKLDAIGAVGVARAFAYGAELKQPLWGHVSPEYRAGIPTGEDHTAHHEFYIKLIRIRDRMYTTAGRRIANQRHQFMVDFFNRMALEVAGEA